MELRTGKPNEFKTIRAAVAAADVLTVMATLPEGSHQLRAGTNSVLLTALFSSAGKSVAGKLWGRLRSTGHAVPVPDGDFSLAAIAQTHAETAGKYISNAELVDVSVFSEIWPEVSTAPTAGTVDILVTEDTDGELID